MKFDTLELVPPLLLQIISCIRYFLANTDCLGFTISTPLMSYVMGISYRLALRASFPRGWVGGGDKAIGTTQPFEGLRYLLEHGGNVGGGYWHLSGNVVCASMVPTNLLLCRVTKVLTAQHLRSRWQY